MLTDAQRSLKKMLNNKSLSLLVGQTLWLKLHFLSHSEDIWNRMLWDQRTWSRVFSATTTQVVGGIHVADSCGYIPHLEIGRYKLWITGIIGPGFYWVVSEPDLGLRALCGLSYFKTQQDYSVETLMMILIVHMDKLRYKGAKWWAQVPSVG